MRLERARSLESAELLSHDSSAPPDSERLGEAKQCGRGRPENSKADGATTWLGFGELRSNARKTWKGRRRCLRISSNIRKGETESSLCGFSNAGFPVLEISVNEPPKSLQPLEPIF